MITSRLLSFRRTPQFSAPQNIPVDNLASKSTSSRTEPRTGTLDADINPFAPNPEPTQIIDGLTPRLTILAAYRTLQIHTESLQSSLDRTRDRARLICVASCGLAIYFAMSLWLFALILKP